MKNHNMLNLRHVETFHAIVRFGSFSAAARELATTQPAVSMRIRELEATLGAKLFDTSTRRCLLTDKGHDFVIHAESLLQLSQRIINDISTQNRPSMHIRIGTTDTIAHTWLNTFVERVTTLNPHIMLDVQVYLTEDVIRLFEARALDIVFIPHMYPSKELVVRSIGSARYVWMASPKLGIADGKRITPAELTQYPLLSLSPASALFRAATCWFREHGVRPSWVNMCSSLGVISSLTASGHGVSLLPMEVYEADISESKLQVLDVWPMFPDTEFFSVFRDDSRSPILEGIVDIASGVSSFKRVGGVQR